jgi:hypothetical protein
METLPQNLARFLSSDDYDSSDEEEKDSEIVTHSPPLPPSYARGKP